MPIHYTSHLRSDGEKMAEAVGRDLDAHVPTCPAWNVAKLTIHTGQHHRWVADAVAGGGTPPADPPKPGLRGDDLVQWFRQGWRDLADLLDRMDDDDAPAWTWSGDDRVGFWRRRTALETLVHRWDAENATGSGTPLDPTLAADGVDEMLFVMMPHGATAYRGPEVHAAIEPSDVPARWTLDLVDGEPPRAAADVTEAASVRLGGTAEELLLFLWGRRDEHTVELGGDDAATRTLLAWIKE